VYERDVAFDDRKQGYGLTLTHNDKGPLAKLNVLEQIKVHDDAASPSNRHWIFHADGSLIGYYGNDFASGTGAPSGGSDSADADSRWQRGNLRIPRQVLRRMLLDRLLPGTVRWGKRLHSISPIPRSASDGGSTEERLVLAFEDGTLSSPCALVVGCDGIRSKALLLLFFPFFSSSFFFLIVRDLFSELANSFPPPRA
jgi:salicylate hydroxylase